ncbi:M20 metallopeptidase family protein [Saccharibacillus endophyticus]|uniref:Amidohydrolase YhaA n=1 Tax=Saccharibacillus endophyticus TaxID=2060666 RepID=A0ABQ1ZYB6_9BACL|nr:amidohydrolase [Saccharibacillus endophyticus]GGH80689.1 putative amidohydrolase YhaA [Saccharibacillus endophyticus]
MTAQTKDQWIERLEGEYEQIVEWRRHMHANPELSFQETNTACFIAETLTGFGYEVRTGVGGNGILADLKGAHPGPSIAFRADFDALPIEEENHVPYKSNNPGVMHACGHDGHTSTLLGVAKVLADRQNELNGSLRFIFQHAEEKLPGGAIAMIEAGALDGIDEVYGAHLASYMPLGKLSVSSGPSMAAVDSFAITVQGKGGHGAKPHQTVDAIVVGSQLVTSLQHIVARHINPLHSAVVTVGVFQAGSAFNVIADKAKIEGTVRSFDPDVRKQLERDIRDMVHGITLAEHATYELDYVNGYPALVNPPRQAEEVRAVFARQFGEEALFGLDASMGAEDFAYYLQHRPGNFFNVGSQNENEDTAFPHHHPRFDIDERALLIAAKAFLAIAADKLLGEA